MRNYGNPRNFLRHRPSRRTPGARSSIAAFFFTLETAHRAFAERLTDLCELAFQVRKQPSGRVLRPVMVRVSRSGLDIFHEPDATASFFANHTNRNFHGVNNG